MGRASGALPILQTAGDGIGPTILPPFDRTASGQPGQMANGQGLGDWSRPDLTGSVLTSCARYSSILLI